MHFSTGSDARCWQMQVAAAKQTCRLVDAHNAAEAHRLSATRLEAEIAQGRATIASHGLEIEQLKGENADLDWALRQQQVC